MLRALDVAATRKAVTKLLECASAFLEGLQAGGGDDGWAAGLAPLAPVLTAKPDLAEEALAVAKAKGECSTGWSWLQG